MYRKSVKISLILVYVVIIAGAMVRMTGSGMGCPDWPKCFGYYIPPYEISELEFQPGRSYKEGQVIIQQDRLLVAAEDFTAGSQLNTENWEVYTKHDYATFNPWHTWIEYLNRLSGAIAGIAVLIMAILSLRYRKTKIQIPLFSWLSVFLMGFQAWLGATVVYSVLAPVKITIHMLMALVIVGVLLYLLELTAGPVKDRRVVKNFRTLMVLAVIFTLTQITLGTQVRQLVDEQIKLLGTEAKSQWLANPNLVFFVHRSFSIIVLLVNLMLWWQNRKLRLGFSRLHWVLLLIILEVITGVAMYNFDFPVLSQPLHLVLAAVLFGLQFYILLEAFRAPVQPKLRNFVSQK